MQLDDIVGGAVTRAGKQCEVTLSRMIKRNLDHAHSCRGIRVAVMKVRLQTHTSEYTGARRNDCPMR